MATNNFKAVATAIVIVIVSMFVTSANAQITRTGKYTHSSRYVPTKEQKAELEKAENVKLVERNGSHNFYIGLKGGITFEAAKANGFTQHTTTHTGSENSPGI